MRSPFESYVRRSIRFGDVWQMGPWRLKAYGIAPLGDRVAPKLWLASQDVMREHLAKEALDLEHYGLGFVTVRERSPANLATLFLWVAEVELLHHTWSSDDSHPMDLRDSGGVRTPLSVWEAYVLSFERHAWTAYVLDNPDGPDFGAYLSARLDDDV